MYVLCFVLVLLVPVAMLVVGVRWWINPPVYKTGKLAYRTAETERSEEVWYFAHQHCAKLWARFGVILAVIAVVVMVALKNNYLNAVLWLMGGEMLLFCITLVIIDFLVKGLFDENGVRIR